MNETLRRAYELRNQGLTYQEIADKFEADGIPTLSGRGAWDKRTIQRKIEQHESELTVKQLRKENEDMTSQVLALQGEIAERDSVINQLNGMIESLKEQLANSVPRNPNNFEGWTLTKGTDGRFRLFKKISGKVIGIYVGKEFTPEIGRQKIAEMMARLKPSVVLLPKKRGRKPKAEKQEAFALSAIPFETRLRVLCPGNRTYRLDAVRSAFPDMEGAAFDKEMIGLAQAKRIELLGGDPRECDPDSLIKDEGITYVNFQWV